MAHTSNAKAFVLMLQPYMWLEKMKKGIKICGIGGGPTFIR